MARVNARHKVSHGVTHEDAPAAAMNAEQALRRSIMSCLLWEKEFYEDGEEIAMRIARLGGQIPPNKLAWMAVEAREEAKLRHVPLLLLSVLAKTGKGYGQVSEVIGRVIQRGDELTEFLAIHAKLNKVKPSDLKKTLSSQMKKGIAQAFPKFDEYQLAKYDRDGDVRLRDALFLSHAKPKDKAQAKLWKRLVDGTLKVPDTWEVALSGGADKKETFERLIRDGKLGYLALLRNLRNMTQAGCDPDLVNAAIIARKGAFRVLPFRFVAAARAAPQFEPAIDQALMATVAEMPALPKQTIVLVDVSGSMSGQLSGKSDMRRVEAAAALASIINGDRRVFAFNTSIQELPPRSGMAGVDSITRLVGGGTDIGGAVAYVNKLKAHRIICITDEQSHTSVPEPTATHAFMVNVGSAQRGVGYGDKWIHLDGFSENILQFIFEYERTHREGI